MDLSLGGARLGGGGKLYELIFFKVSVYDLIEKRSILFVCILSIKVSRNEVKYRIFSGVLDDVLTYWILAWSLLITL